MQSEKRNDFGNRSLEKWKFEEKQFFEKIFPKKKISQNSQENIFAKEFPKFNF